MSSKRKRRIDHKFVISLSSLPAMPPHDPDAAPGTESEFKAFIGGLSYSIDSEALKAREWGWGGGFWAWLGQGVCVCALMACVVEACVCAGAGGWCWCLGVCGALGGGHARVWDPHARTCAAAAAATACTRMLPPGPLRAGLLGHMHACMHACSISNTCSHAPTHAQTPPPDFERYDASSAEVMMDKMTGRPRGFGFVYFKDEGGLKDAIRDMHEKVRGPGSPGSGQGERGAEELHKHVRGASSGSGRGRGQATSHTHPAAPFRAPIPPLPLHCTALQEIEGRRISVVRAVPQDQTRPGTPAAALGAGERWAGELSPQDGSPRQSALWAHVCAHACTHARTHART